MNPKMKPIFKVMLFLSWIASVMIACFIIALSSFFIIFYGHEQPPDPEIALEINNSIGSGHTSWYGVLCYLYYDAANPGSTIEEVHSTLSEIGPWEIIYEGRPHTFLIDFRPVMGEYEEIIQFTEENTNKVMNQWVFFYDENGKLIEKRVRSDYYSLIN